MIRITSLVAASLSILPVFAVLPTPMSNAASALLLPPAQQPRLDRAKASLKTLQANLKLAQDSAGGGTAAITGSKARLVQSRLNQAIAYVDPTKQDLDALPADDAGVIAVRAELTSAEAAIKALQNRLNSAATPQTPPAPQPAPTPGTPPAPPAAAPLTVKLDYRQVEQLKNARFHVNEVEGNVAALKQRIAAYAAISDKHTIDYREVQAAINTIENAKRKSGFATENLAPLPANGAGVDETQTRLTQAIADVAAAEATLLPLHKELQSLIDPKNYPELLADLKRVAGFSQMYGDPMLLQADRPRAAEVFTVLDAARTEAARVASLYAPLVLQRTEEGKQVDGTSRYFTERLTEFTTAADAQRTALPAEIAKDLKDAAAMADEAVVQKRPAWFSGGIPQRVSEISGKIALLEALDPPAGTAPRKHLEDFKTELTAKEKALAESIIQQNPLPPDRYTGEDKAALIAKAIATWKEEQPDAEVLASFIADEKWKRDTQWRWETSGWRFIDRSRLQVQLLVKHDDRLAVNRPINFSIDHTSSDTLSAGPLDALADVLGPQRFVLREKIK